MRFDYWGYYAIQNWFGPVKPPEREIDTERIISIILKETGLTENDVTYYWIGTHFLLFDSANMSDPSGDTWAVSITLKDKHYYYTVNLAEVKAIKEDFNG